MVLRESFGKKTETGLLGFNVAFYFLLTTSHTLLLSKMFIQESFLLLFLFEIRTIHLFAMTLFGKVLIRPSLVLDAAYCRTLL